MRKKTISGLSIDDRDYRAMQLMKAHEGLADVAIIRMAVHEFMDKRGYWDRVPVVIDPDATM